MGFQFHHLADLGVRDTMVAHWQAEWVNLSANWPRGQCYGKQLTEVGWRAFELAMPEALWAQDDDWLLAQMDRADYWEPLSPRRTKSGVTMVDYDKQDALTRLTCGEFNIAYIAGVAHVLLGRGETHCVVYRADRAYVPRDECSAWEDREFPLTDVLAGHRARYFPPPGNKGIWSVPAGPNCHHSIRAVPI